MRARPASRRAVTIRPALQGQIAVHGAARPDVMRDDDQRGAGLLGRGRSAGRRRRGRSPIEAGRRLVGDDEPAACAAAPARRRRAASRRATWSRSTDRGGRCRRASRVMRMPDRGPEPRRTPASRAGSSTLSRADRPANRWKSCMNEADIRGAPAIAPASDKAAMSMPPQVTSPLVGRSRPVTMLTRVVLPEPDGPVIARRSPARSRGAGMSSTGPARPAIGYGEFARARSTGIGQAAANAASRSAAG